MVVALVAERLRMTDCKVSHSLTTTIVICVFCKTRGWILDGVPNSESQASALAKLGFCPDRVLLMQCAADVARARVTLRRVDRLTGQQSTENYPHSSYHHSAGHVFTVEAKEVANALTRIYCIRYNSDKVNANGQLVQRVEDTEGRLDNPVMLSR